MTATGVEKTFEHNLKLDSGSSVAVIGSGPAGSFFSFFLLELAERAGLNISVDIYDNKDFSKCGPAGCNHCGGIVSESLVQLLATEGINIPTKVAQKGMASFVLYVHLCKSASPPTKHRLTDRWAGKSLRFIQNITNEKNSLYSQEQPEFRKYFDVFSNLMFSEIYA